jgi:hypothetical protein
MFFGLVIGLDREFGIFSLSELEQVNEDAGFSRITLDQTFRPTTVTSL